MAAPMFSAAETTFILGMIHAIVGALIFSEKIFDENSFHYKAWNLYPNQAIAAFGILLSLATRNPNLRPTDTGYVFMVVAEIAGMVFTQLLSAFWMVRIYMVHNIEEEAFQVKFYIPLVVLNQIAFVVLLLNKKAKQTTVPLSPRSQRLTERKKKKEEEEQKAAEAKKKKESKAAEAKETKESKAVETKEKPIESKKDL